MTAAAVGYLPIATTLLAAVFVGVLYRHWRRTGGPHLAWWMAGVAAFGIGSAAEGAVLMWGWQPWLFRMWYVSGALLGGAPLAQGTAYLVHRRETADRLAVGLAGFVAVAAASVILTPLTAPPPGTDLSGKVMVWSWIRALTPIINTYAVGYLVGGAAWSAIRYARQKGSGRRALGNTFIALGGVAPAVGGLFSRFGRAGVLSVTELVGLALIWLGYRTVVGSRRGHGR